MAVPSASCTYSWPVWTEDLKAGAPAALTGLASHSSHCMPRAHEPQPGFHSCPDGHPGGSVPAHRPPHSCGLRTSSPAAAAQSCFSGQLQPESCCCCNLSGRFIKCTTVPDFLIGDILWLSQTLAQRSPQVETILLQVPVQLPDVASRGQQSAGFTVKGCPVSFTLEKGRWSR